MTVSQAIYKNIYMNKNEKVESGFQILNPKLILRIGLTDADWILP